MSNTGYPRLFAGWLVAFLGGVGAGVGGLLFFDAQPKADRSTRLNARSREYAQPSKDFQSNINRFPDRAARSASESLSIGAAVQPDTALRRDAIALLAKLKAQKKIDVRIPMITQQGKLAGAFKELFELSGSEIFAIELAIQKQREEIAALAIAHASVEKNGDKITVAIQPFASGAESYDSFMDTMQNILGSHRYPAFQQLSGNQFDSLFHEFGAEARTLTFAYSGDGNDAGPIAVTDVKRLSTGVETQTIEFPNREALLTRYVGFERFFPGAK